MTTQSVFASHASEVFTTYDCVIKFRDRLLGGVPKDPKIIEGWLRAKAGIDSDFEVRQAMLRTLVELGAEVSPDMSYEELTKAAEHLATVKQTNGFKIDDNGLYFEDRQIKSAIKESVNILYAGDRWGKTKKGPRNFTAERVFVQPAHISLGRKAPDGIELRIIHASGPQGPINSLGYYEYVEGAECKFSVMVTKDEIAHEHWPEIWLHLQENGLGACRSQSFGRFDVTEWKVRK